MKNTITKWVNKHEFTSHLGHNAIHINGNKVKGFGPKALLLYAVAACSGIDIVEILAKMRILFSEFEIEVKADQTDGHPRVFTDIYITYKIRADIALEDKIRKAIELSLEKYCGVAAMLKKNSSIHYSLEIA